MDPDVLKITRIGLLAAAMGVCPLSGLATTELALQLDSSWRYDANPLRFVEGTDIQAALARDRKSDAVLSNDVRAVLVHPLDSPQTRLILSGQLGRRQYEQLAQLDNTEYAYRAALEWRLGDLWTGEASRSQDQVLYTYLDGSLTSREMIHRTTDHLAVTLKASPDVELPLIVRQRRTGYDTAANQAFDSTERSIDFSARWNTGTRSTLRGGVRSTEVRFPSRTPAQVQSLDSGYRDDEAYVETDWQYSVMTRFSGRVAALKRSYDSLVNKSFSALTAEVKVSYEHSPLTRFTLDLWQRPYGMTDISTLYTTQTGAQLGVRWQPSAKMRLTLQVADETQRYQFAVLQPGQANPQLHRSRWGGGVVYALSRDVRLYADGFKERLDRGSLGAGIQQTSVRTGIEYTYENLPGVSRRNGLGERQ